MCDKFLNKSGQEHVEKLSVDESCITKKCFLKLTEDRSDQDIPTHVLGTTKYPKANLYYAFAEDTHPKKRIDTASKIFEEQKFVSHSASFKERFTNQEKGFTNHSNLEKEAVNHYLRTEPPSFVIFGKPGLLHGKLASAIADSWNCVLISPKLVIRQEIDAGTEKGQYIENILRSGKSVEYNKIIMDLMRCRIGKRDVKHRGYVVEFSPLIPDMNFDDSSYSSTSVNMNTCPEFCENTVSENSEAQEDLITSNDVRCKTEYKYEQEIARQIDVMFTVWPRKPLIIIYLICPKQDLANRCARWRIDRTSQEYNIFDENEYMHLYNGNESDTSYDFSQVANEQSIMNIQQMSSVFFDKLHCDIYEQYALPVIDKWILAHDPQYVIRVDGRSSTRRILQILETRLCVLALQPSILPKKMIVQDDVNFLENSEEINLNDEPAEKSAEEIFEILKQREVVSPKYLWKLSAWKYYCPVALAQGRTIKGHSKHAIRFLSKIFFLSSQEAMNLFIENPRTFLLPPNPRSTCKIAVFGPKYAGKSELSVRLAETFGGIVINVDEIMKKLIKQREESLNQKLSENDLNVQISLDSIDISVDEKADIIIQNIKEIPEMELEDELRRDGGYVVDGMCVDHQVWRKIVDANIIFEDIIVLFENEPYAYLLNKFRNFFYLDNLEHKVERYEAGDTEEDQEEYRMSHEEWEYLEHLTRFASEWIKFEEQILEFGGNVIRCNLADIENVIEYVINHIKNRFDTSVSAQEKDQENEIQQEEATAAEIETSLATENDKRENEYLAYSIDLETAEQLLNCGYFFFSTFGRWCPVQVYANKIPIQMFLPMKDRGQIFPVVYHPYIYFLAGKAALIAFLNDFSRYLTIDCRPSLIPLRISIIGPPHSGKTTLANRFAETYGMKIINHVKALRHMVKYYLWTESGRKAEHDELRAGQPASVESVMRAIEIFSIGPRAATQGYILDDCPSNRKEAELFVLLGMQPMIVLDLKADLEFCIECFYNDPIHPGYPVNFLEEWYKEWQENQAIFRDWLKKFSQNVIELDVTKNKWHVWTRADCAVRSRFADIMLYFNEADLEKAHSLKHMCVSPYEFRSRQSQYTSYCPVCWFFEKNLKTSGQSVDSQGMIQFREYFYWICPQHMNTFIEDPLQYVSPVKAISLPDDRPRILKQIVDTEHACWVQRLQVSGLCLVTYVDSLPDRKLMKGRDDLGVIFKGKVYLFCSENCREKFLAQHNKYSEMDIVFPPPIKMQDLSNVDFLKQTVARILIEAVNVIAVRRPKIFGLSAAVSAAIYIGVYMKTHNTSEHLHEVDIYEAVNERIEGLHRIIEIVTNVMKKKINPYVSLPKYPS
ncbi:adenylate kinase 9-like [Cataglyphis hispanica]|uniref:adenylate kinase 9-like n=1 Tax=Cataglyphis hispanica TaxID=1086592 RepID=UPI00217F7BF9|nr:adenylate kinase 9-like [Cataglyphis hispanica]